MAHATQLLAPAPSATPDGPRAATAGFLLTLDAAEPVTPALVRRVTDVCDQVESAETGDTLLVSLTGTASRTGAELPSGVHVVNKWERALRRLERLPVATVAVATGACHGPAAEVLLATDHRIAGADLTLRLATAGTATWPSMALHRLVQQIGVTRSRRIALFGAELSAWQALEIGLVNEVAEDPRDAVAAALAGLAGARAGDVAVRRRLLTDAATTDFEEALGTHLAACDRALRAQPRE